MSKYIVKDSYGDDEKYDSMINAMDGARVFGIEKKGIMFRIEERCDDYFSADLTRDQLIALGRELIDLAESS